MPAAGYTYPQGMFADHDHAVEFCTALQRAVAREMSGVNPEGEQVVFNPETDVDVTATAYDTYASHTTSVVLVTVVSYRWPSRMEDMTDRLRRIGEALKPLVPTQFVTDLKKAVNVTFLSKEAGCWVEV